MAIAIRDDPAVRVQAEDVDARIVVVARPALVAAQYDVVVIGTTMQRELFADTDPLGQQLRVKSFFCEVVGVIAAKGQGAMGLDQDDMVVLPLRTLQ